MADGRRDAFGWLRGAEDWMRLEVNDAFDNLVGVLLRGGGLHRRRFLTDGRRGGVRDEGGSSDIRSIFGGVRRRLAASSVRFTGDEEWRRPGVGIC